ncbi:MAG: 3-hydroxyacyl-CoA dehydrogenase family protein [Thermomicrobiales bacterium]|nr:3-hydroxyacyl-CoA dehydrogenase family protein [Thermomicrobiales bacterium]
MKIALLGPGLMGAQIACEYALGGHDVVVLARRVDAAEERLARSWATAAAHQLATDAEIAAAQQRLLLTTDVAQTAGSDIIVESVIEDLAQKAEAVKPVLVLSPEAVVASNTSSIPITSIGEAVGAPEQTVGAHYWNPPLLMPLVEVIRGEATSDAAVETMEATVRSLGKRPVRVDRDVPGFVWNRLQLALLREAVWIVERGVASPAVVDEIVRDGLARRWRHTGPFQTAALGGASTFEKVAANLWPVLSRSRNLDDLRQWLDESPETTQPVRERRDAGLAADLRADRTPEAGG